MAKDSLDWWGKPEQKDNPKGSKNGKKSEKKEEISGKGFALRIVINGALIGLFVVLVAIGAHFTLQSLTRHGANCVVPQLLDLTLSEAEALAVKNDLHLVINDSLYAPGVERGVILAQIPAEGTVVKPGRTVYLSINATHKRMVDVPYVAGRSLRQAKNMLEVAGLVISRLEYEDDIATNYILGQSYNGREVTAKSNLKIPVGSGVTLRVGVDKDHNSTIVPDVMGRSIHATRSALWGAGLNVGEVKAESDINIGNEHLAMVYSQSIPADSTVSMGRSVSLRLTLKKEVLDRAYKEAEKAAKIEQFVADSIAMFDELEVAVDTTEVVEQRRRPTVQKVEFEDLF